MDIAEVRASLTRRHPWETARARAIGDVITAVATKVDSILDYGCGDGFTGIYVAQRLGAKQLVGFDIHLQQSSDNQLRETRVALTNREAELSQRAFDCVLLCDVLEHVEDDGALLRRIASEFCRPAARIMITVPAFPALFSEHDRAMKHYRRYRLRDLLALVHEVGLKTEGDGYLFGSLLGIRTVTKLREFVHKTDRADTNIGNWPYGAKLTTFLESVLNFDNQTMLALRRHHVALPGLTAWALCQTPFDGRDSVIPIP